MHHLQTFPNEMVSIIIPVNIQYLDLMLFKERCLLLLMQIIVARCCISGADPGFVKRGSILRLQLKKGGPEGGKILGQ